MTAAADPALGFWLRHMAAAGGLWVQRIVAAEADAHHALMLDAGAQAQ